MTKVTKAVIPAAGLGTRFLPLTKSMPKEMLPVVHKPVIQYVVEEAYESGITDILIITGKGKRAIEDYFDHLDGEISNEYLDELDILLDSVNIFYVRQRSLRGLGDAISYASSFIDNDPFAVLLGDTITTPPCTKELIECYQKCRASVIAVEKVPLLMVRSYGIIDGQQIDEDTIFIRDLVEKPDPDNAPSDLAILGSYVLTPTIMDCIKETKPGKGGEIQLTDALRILKDRENLYAHLYRGRRYDIGNKTDWLKANIELGMKDPIIGKEIRNTCRELCNGIR
ncbi:MAG TPA: UTP--glucose-1-phosphate uridylyltransferase [Methanoregulaceae archaeon]|nr:UTP--glucose-1-phosphate uridylyltransferase [Methanoregulaceae archaeon]